MALASWWLTPHLDDRLTAGIALALTAGTYGLVYWLGASRLGYLPQKLTLPFMRRARPEPVGASH